MNLTTQQLITALNIDLNECDILSKIQQRRAEQNVSYQYATDQIYSEIISKRIHDLVNKIEKPKQLYLQDIMNVLYNYQDLIIHYNSETIYASTPSINEQTSHTDMWLTPIYKIDAKENSLDIWLKGD